MNPCADCHHSVFNHAAIWQGRFIGPEYTRGACEGTASGWTTVAGVNVYVAAEPCDCPRYVEQAGPEIPL
jgi:hypothetical protein